MPKIDFGRTADDYRRHRAGFPVALLPRLQALGLGLKGQQVLDLGTGTGTLARLFAQAGCTVTGLDPAEALLAQARELDAEAGVEIQYRVAKAEATGLAGGHFDVVAAGQCWHWFDRAKAAAEMRRLLRPGGKALITHFDWIALPGNMVAATEEMIVRFNPEWKMGGGSGVYPRWYQDLGQAGFEGLESFTFDTDVPYTQEAWRGRIRASAGISASLSPEQVTAFDAAHTEMLRKDFPSDPLLVPHRVFALVATSPSLD